MSTLTPQQALQMAANAGFKGASQLMIVAIAMAESNLRTDAVGPVGEIGVTQIYLSAHPDVSRSCALDPQCNFNAAFKISNGGTNFRPWCTAWSDGLCGSRGGTYLGASAPFQKFLKQLGGTSPVSSTGTPSSSSSTGGCDLWDIGCIINGIVHNQYFERGWLLVVALILAVVGIVILFAGKGATVVEEHPEVLAA